MVYILNYYVKWRLLLLEMKYYIPAVLKLSSFVESNIWQ
jgi:hypothetical protein